MVVEIHHAAMIWTLTSPVAANQLVAALFSLKMTTQDLTSPVAAIQLAAGAFFPKQAPAWRGSYLQSKELGLWVGVLARVPPSPPLAAAAYSLWVGVLGARRCRQSIDSQ